MKSNTAMYAERELNILVKTVKDPIIKPFIPEIIKLCDKFGKSGQSGGSAPTVATAISQAIKKLCLQEPICGITGIKDEWMNVSGDVYQNRRCSALFKEEISGRAYYLDAIIFKTQTGATYASNSGALMENGERIKSRQYITGYPFNPKTFYIDVIEKEIGKDDWEFYVKDARQLRAAFKYYDYR